MQEIIADKGMGYGRVSVIRTLATMQPGETWNTKADAVNLQTIRSAASRYGFMSGRRFSISTLENDIKVTRVF